MLVSFWAVAVQSCNSLHKRADTSSAYGLTIFNTSVQLLEQQPDSWNLDALLTVLEDRERHNNNQTSRKIHNIKVIN